MYGSTSAAPGGSHGKGWQQAAKATAAKGKKKALNKKTGKKVAANAMVVAAAVASSPLPYLAISASILPNDPQAPFAREALVQRIDLEPHQWATADTALVQVQTIAQMQKVLDDLEVINTTFDTCFEAIAFLVPHKQLWWISENPMNLPALVGITGRQPR